MPNDHGSLTFTVVPQWGQIPSGWTLKQVAAVAVDDQDRVYVFNRGDHPVVIFDRQGRFLTSWGEGLFSMAHGIYLGADETLYLVDAGQHTVRQFTLDGRLIRTLGTPGQPAEDGKPFNKPTDIAVAPSGDLYISDGYGNNRVHRFSAEGTLLQSWGRLGSGPGEFNLPHSIWVDREERVYVADRENHRIQIFTPRGEYLTEWHGFQRPCDIYMDNNDIVYIPELEHRLSILSRDGKLLARWGETTSHAPGQFVAPHAAWTDTQGDLYIGEVLEGQRIQKFTRKPASPG